MLRGVVAMIRESTPWRRRQLEQHVPGPGRVDAPAALVRLPRRPDALLRTAAWRPIAQLADQRIRAHRAERLSIGEIVETVSHEVEDAIAAQPLASSLGAWRSWAAATDTPWPAAMRGADAGISGADEVELALHVQSDLAALMPQLVACRLSENAT